MQNQRILKKISLLLSLVFFTISCSENKIDTNQQGKKTDFLQKQNQQKKYQLKNTTLTQKWLLYNQLSDFINEINNEDFSMFIDKDIFIKKFFIDLNKSLPDDLNLKEVSSRLLVIETDFWLFVDELNSLDEKKKLNHHIEKINISFSNLNFQIDNVFTKKK